MPKDRANERLEWTWPSSSVTGVRVTGIGFVVFSGSPEAGHATQPPCSPDSER
jgi:hypothetical protein